MADYWEVGGTLTRSPKSDFPTGLELAREPFTLRLASTKHTAMTAAHEQDLREIAKKLRTFLQESGVTGHPLLGAPSDASQQALQLAKKERFATGEQLAAAISFCCPAEDWQLFVCRYGLKIPAKPFYAKLCRMRETLTEELGELRAKTTWDFGTQSILSGKICLVAPSLTKFLPFVDARKIYRYSLFGAQGCGSGGVETAGADAADVLKVIAYPGKYTHQLKTLGAPNAFPPRNVQQGWFAGQWAQVQALVAELDKLDDHEVAWEELHGDLSYYFEEIAKRLTVDVLEGAKLAPGQATGPYEPQGTPVEGDKLGKAHAPAGGV